MPYLATLRDNLKKMPAQRWVLILFVIFALFLNLHQTIDQDGKKYIDRAFNRALITFGLAKSLNGIISLAQGTEVAIQPAGIGINLTPGQILDPVNDLVERFSWIMLASSTSLGIQKVFLNMTSWSYFRYILAASLLITLLFMISKRKEGTVCKVLVRASLAMIILRFTVPLAGLGNEAIYQIFLQQDYQTSNQVLKTTAEDIEMLNQQQAEKQPDVGKKSVWESARDFYRSTSEMLDINQRIEKYKQAAAESGRHIIDLIVVFVLQTIIIPLGFLFLAFQLSKRALKADF